MAGEGDPQDAANNMGNHLPLLPGNRPGPVPGGGRGRGPSRERHGGAGEAGGRYGAGGAVPEAAAHRAAGQGPSSGASHSGSVPRVGDEGLEAGEGGLPQKAGTPCSPSSVCPELGSQEMV